MEAILLRLESRLDEVTKTLTELKAENEILRKRIIGNGDSESSNPLSATASTKKNKTLWEIAEDIQLQMTQLNNQIGNVQSHEDGILEVFAGEYEVLEIRSKTLADERNWMKSKFEELIQHKTITNGLTLREKVVEDIASSIVFSSVEGACCVLKLSNFLDCDLEDPQYHFWHGSLNCQPSVNKVTRHVSEVITMTGDRYYCYFMCSFAIRRSLRLTILCYVCYNGEILFGTAFTPQELPTDTKLFKTINQLPSLPDVWITKQASKDPIELFVNHGNLIAKGHITPGPRSIAYVEIVEIIDELEPPRSQPKMKRITNGKTVTPHLSIFTQIPREKSSLTGSRGGFSCSIEIVNCLNVNLKNWSQLNCFCKSNNYTPSVVLPSTRELFFARNNEGVEAMFSYGIDSTDLGLEVALENTNSCNSFAAAFVQLPVVTGKGELENMMSPNQWKTHVHRTHAMAREGEKTIEMRNIRAVICMTEEDQAHLKIRVCAV